MKTYRRQIILELLDKVGSLIDYIAKRRGPSLCSAQGPVADGEERRRCEAMSYGLICVRLMDEGLWPLHESLTTPASVDWVRNRLRPALEEPVAWWFPSAHKDCQPFAKASQEVSRIMNEAPVPKPDQV